MTFFFLPVGIFLPTIIGWMTIRLLEGGTPVLFRFERWTLGCVSGLTFTMLIVFIAHITGLIGFTFLGFLLVQLVTVFVLTFFCRKHLFPPNNTYPPFRLSIPKSPYLIIIITIISIWTLIKIASGIALLVASPPYHDDAFNNWNMRGKLFYETNRLTLTIPLGDELVSSRGVSSYPPTVPMIKTWLALIHGQWNEGLINSVHALWYVSVLILTFFFLVRLAPPLFALAGTYALSSIPLFMMHGMSPYADVFLSVHILAAIGTLLFAIQKNNMGFLRISMFFTALLPFTKNEALLVYAPPLLLITTMYLIKHKKMSYLFVLFASFVLFTFPWLSFKWFYDLPFGNAKAISGFALQWQSGVPYAIWIMTFFEGNWLLLFPTLFAGIALPLLPMTVFFFIAYIGQLPLYLFTSLGEEAIKQTGYARGLIHLIPIACVLTTALLYDVFRRCQIISPSSDINRL
jgi:hypothetical protein